MLFFSCAVDFNFYSFVVRSSVQFTCSVVSDSLQPHGLQHARLPCPLTTPREPTQTHVNCVGDVIQPSNPGGEKGCLKLFSFIYFLIYQGLICDSRCDISSRMFHVHLRKQRNLHFLKNNISCRYILGPCDPMYHL